ncbi:hypothetical protein KSX_77150 [Ktedonospora formicarum]|uniref:Uncharacterized protein n=1 Tax=Ktedonospora formicarum TaxID=2778364 RepID=A0A8J3IBD6_9CHLR|nr:hypothetical protein KSX_77150 [Ktedonospora formicarum]
MALADSLLLSYNFEDDLPPSSLVAAVVDNSLLSSLAAEVVADSSPPNSMVVAADMPPGSRQMDYVLLIQMADRHTRYVRVALALDSRAEL